MVEQRQKLTMDFAENIMFYDRKTNKNATLNSTIKNKNAFRGKKTCRL